MNESIKQEIEDLREEISQDECLRDTSDFSDFHERRIAETTERLDDLLDAYPEFKTKDGE